VVSIRHHSVSRSIWVRRRPSSPSAPSITPWPATHCSHQVTGAEEWNINAFEASALDYNTNFKPDSQISDLYAADQYRASDHDPMLIGLDLTSDTIQFVG
jgi:xanthine dehydrogenase iron-sulfur cluster and FAD-binding subunit A